MKITTSEKSRAKGKQILRCESETFDALFRALPSAGFLFVAEQHEQHFERANKSVSDGRAGEKRSMKGFWDFSPLPLFSIAIQTHGKRTTTRRNTPSLNV